MARDVKPLILRTVDDDLPPEEVIRLGDPAFDEPREKPVRLGTAGHDSESSQRLELPAADFGLRTHEPGIEAIMEPETVAPEVLEQNWGQEAVRRQPVPWGWFALVGVAILGALFWSLTRLKDSGQKAVQIRSETESSLVDEQKEERDAAKLVDRMDETLRAFFSANSVDGLLRLVRQPERVEPLMRDYYGEHPPVPGRLRAIKMMQPITLDDHGNFWVAAVDLGENKAHNLIVEIGKAGDPRVDWETLVCYQPMKWNDFATRRTAGKSLDFRVYVERDDFYSHEFADPKQWRCFRLTALDSEETLFGYVRNGSAGAEDLVRLVDQQSGHKASLILRLLVPEGIQSRRGVVIEKVMSSRWLYIDPPDSDS